MTNLSQSHLEDHNQEILKKYVLISTSENKIPLLIHNFSYWFLST